MKLINAIKGAYKAAFVIAILTVNEASAAAKYSEPVPTQTHFRALKVIRAQFPEAQNIKTAAYRSESISGLVGKVINASTVIYFTEGGVEKSVIMLPDGQHLIIGEMINTSSTASLPKTRSAIEALKPKSVPLPTVEERPYKPTSKQSSFLDGYRLKPQDLEQPFDDAAKSPEEYMQRIESLASIATGKGEKHVYILTDPNCPNCRKEYLSSLNYNDSFTFHWIPIYALTSQPTRLQVQLSQESNELNLSNLKALMTDPQTAATNKFETSKEVALKLSNQQRLFFNLADKKTPITLFRNSDGVPTKITGHNPKLFEYISDDMSALAR